MVQQQFLRLSPLGFALGCAAATLVYVVIRVITFGFGYGMWHAGHTYGGYGMGGAMMSGGMAGFAFLMGLGAIVFAGILGAVLAWVYNASVRRAL